MISSGEVEFNKLSTQFCSKIINAILDAGAKNLELGKEMLEKMNAELTILLEKQKEHEECTTKLLQELKKIAESSLANLTSKVLTNSFDKNLVTQRIDAFKHELKVIIDHSDDIENVNRILFKKKSNILALFCHSREYFIDEEPSDEPDCFG